MNFTAAERRRRVDRLEPKSAADLFELNLAFTAPTYTQVLQAALALLSPPAIGTYAARAAEVRQFFDRIRAARSSPVVLKNGGNQN